MNKEQIIDLLKANGMTDAEIAAFANGGKKCGNTYKRVETIRLYWGDKPSKDVREEMGKAGYHWNSFEKFWYADATDAALEIVAKYNFEEAR